MAKPGEKKKVRVSPISSDVPARGAIISGLPSWHRREWFWGLLLAVAVLVAYLPVWHAGFIWDDDDHVTRNPCIVGPLGLKEIWTTRAGQFFPLVLTTFWFEHALWGLAPVPCHLVNVFQHMACAILLWSVLKNLRVVGAWLGAALWALHPVQVESVAWISEMKNTQSCFFYLLTILFWVRLPRAPEEQKSRTRLDYLLTLLCALLAMMSKSSTVVLPAVLALGAWYVEGRWHWRNLPRLIPVMLMSLVSIAVTLWPSPVSGTIADAQSVRTWAERVATAGDAIWFYPAKLLWPQPLMTVYPRWNIDAGSWASYLPLALAVILVCALWRLKRDSWLRPCFFAVLYFLVVLSPFLGLIDQTFWRYSFVEDHLQYLACMGPLALAGAAMTRLVDFMIPARPGLRAGLCAGLLLILGALSWQRSDVYASEETLWTDTLAKNPDCWVGHNNLGDVLIRQGRVDEAGIQYRQALETNPDYDLAHNNLGTVLLRNGQVEEAMAHFQKALEVNPRFASAQVNLGNAFFQEGQMDKAIAHYDEALAIDPGLADADYDLGNAFFRQGQVDEAIQYYQKSLEINPANITAHNNLGVALAHEGKWNEAIAQFAEALRLDPADRNAQINLEKMRERAQR